MCGSLFQVLNISSQDMQSRIQDLANSSNSIANINTNGYKNSRLNFQELLEEATLSGVKSSSSQIMTTQGKLVSTGVNTDVAINGDGYFAVKLPDKTIGYTRDGSFQLDENNQIQTANGYPIVIEGTIPKEATDVTIDQHGTIFALVDDVWEEAGSLKIYRFTNASGMTHIGKNILIESVNSGKAVAGDPGSTNYGILVPGTLESSNVNMAEEMTKMIKIQRSFSMASTAFQTTAEMIYSAIHLRKV
jgi:flagellar basal-body rod protein FlgG